VITIGADYHRSGQYIALVDTETGERGERRLNHSGSEAEKFHRELAARGVSVRVGDGGHRPFTLVRAVTGRTGYRGMDRRCGLTMTGLQRTDELFGRPVCDSGTAYLELLARRK